MTEKYRNFIRTLPCLVCKNPIETEAAHVRFADARAAKPASGVGIKPADHWLVPLCSRHHRDQHSVPEKEWWSAVGIDPIFVAMALTIHAFDVGAADQIIRNAKLH